MRRRRLAAYGALLAAWFVACPGDQSSRPPGHDGLLGERPPPEREEPFWAYHGVPELADHGFRTFTQVGPTTYCVPPEGRPASVGPVRHAWHRAFYFQSSNPVSGRQLIGARDGRLYTRSGDTLLFLDREFGWPEFGAAPFGTNVENAWAMLGPPGTLVLPSSHLLVISTHDARTQFFLDGRDDLGAPINWHGGALVKDDETIVVALQDGRILEVDRQGRVVWSATGPAGPTGLVRDEALGAYHVASFHRNREPDAVLARVDDDGTVAWQREFQSLSGSSIFLTAGGNLVVRARPGPASAWHIFGVDRLSGDIAWTWPDDSPDSGFDVESGQYDLRWPVPHPAGGWLIGVIDRSVLPARDILYWVGEDLTTEWVLDIAEVAIEAGWAEPNELLWNVDRYAGTADGTVYASGATVTGYPNENDCRIFAIAPDGAVRWFTHARHPVREILPTEDGRLYVYMIPDMQNTPCRDGDPSGELACDPETKGDFYRVVAAYDTLANGEAEEL